MTKRKSKKKNVVIGSVFTGTAFGVLAGWYLSGLVDLSFIPYVQYIFMVAFATIFGFFATRRPVFVEYIAYATSIFIFYQALWDFRVFDWSYERGFMTVTAIILFIINLSSGRIKLVGAKKTAKNAIGL